MRQGNKENYKNMDIARIGNETWIKDLYGPKTRKIIYEVESSGKFVDILANRFIKRSEGRKIYT